ncbi:methyltransferase domain-containing protein [Colletotrichum incanum]|uniref:Methyltransferase domain-containing protein n=1 Tax=Colletotrichum incanum TaxID=1573173 RepID=A0A166M312_COLIC|nr:methyltransferase domain-containing protein [Colletotrichum incanum]
MLDGLEGFTLKVFREVLGRTQEEVLIDTANVHKKMKESTYHGIYDLSHVVYGPKLLVNEPSEAST